MCSLIVSKKKKKKVCQVVMHRAEDCMGAGACKEACVMMIRCYCILIDTVVPTYLMGY